MDRRNKRKEKGFIKDIVLFQQLFQFFCEYIICGIEKDEWWRFKIKMEKGKKKGLKTINKEVIEVRNVLAHVEESTVEKNTLVSKNKKFQPIKIDENWCNTTRKNFKRHTENLEKIINHI